VETQVSAALQAAGLGRGGGAAGSVPHHSIPLSRVPSAEENRISSGIAELDRALGGGIMRQGTVLVGGEPGIGKSTLLLQLAALAETKGRVLYVSGEESASQIKLRADRLRLDTSRIELFCSARLEEIETTLNALRPVIIIIDSAQTLYTLDAGTVPGTINQMKYCCFELITWAKEHDASLVLVAHVTKEGAIAGPKTLEHMVDTVLYFEQTQSDSSLSNAGDTRFLRAAKNRFGSVDEIGIFTMGEKGLSVVDDPSALFLVRRETPVPAGVATAAVLEGSRTLLVEIQALTVQAKGAISRVFSDRIESARVSRVAATIEKALKLKLSDQDIYVNVAGGIRLQDVGVDLALASAVYSARTGLPIPAGTAIAGELSLAAEVRPVRKQESRAKTVGGLGFTRFVCPKMKSADEKEASKSNPESKSIVAPVRTLDEAIRAIFKP
jgi:DNA repair protein RadA/Sms